MVTATTVEKPGSYLLGDTDGVLTFRVRSPEHNGRILRVRSPKCLIGSHPSCTLRLRAAGVRPFHCLILRGTEGMFIRRLSAGTCLNGAGFTDSRLKPGDRLDIGPIELEVLELSRIDESNAPIEPNTCSPPATYPPATDTALGKVPDPPRDALPPDHDSHQNVCQKCRHEREEREELETALAARVEQGDRERGELTQKYLQLVGDLTRAEAVSKDLAESTEKQTDQLHERRADYRETIAGLRQDLVLLRQRHDTQLSEQARLVAEAAEATERAVLLEVELRELKQQVHDERTRLDKTDEQLAAQRDEYNQQLAAARAELLQRQQDGQTQASEWASTRRQLDEQLQQVRQQLDDATAELDASRQQSATLDAQLQESTRQQQLSAEAAEHAADRVGKCEDELAVLCQELQEQRSQPSQQQQAEWESTRQQLSEQLQQLRQQLDDTTAERDASRQQSMALETELRELVQRQGLPADSQEHAARLLQQREEELAALQREFDEQRQQWRQDSECWQADEQQLREELRDLNGRWQEAIGSHAAATSRVTELESLLEEASQTLTGIAETGQGTQRRQEENAAELSKLGEVVHSLRHELQQEREQHQCARNEWHADRESLQRELAERSSSLEQLQMKNNQEMQEAEFLIHSLQQEGKQLLSQLDEAKQVIRKDVERHKRTDTPRNNFLSSKGELPSRSQTMPMPAGLLGRGRLKEDPPADVHEPVAQPAATSDASPLAEADEPAANHTIMMSPAELVQRGWSDETADAPAVTPLLEAAADETSAVPEPRDAACPGEEPPTEKPAAEEQVAEESVAEESAAADLAAAEPVVEEPAAEEPVVAEPAAAESGGAEFAPDQVVIGERTMVLDADALSSCAIALVEESQAEQQAAQSPMEQAWSMLASAPDEPDPNDEEGVIQRYMERLLKRVASQGREGVDEPPVLTRKQPARRPDVAVVAPGTKAPVIQPAPPAETMPLTGGGSPPKAANTAGEASPLSVVSRSSTPEMATDLLAMRQLANRSARQAINSSDQRRFLTVAVGELLVSAVCLASSCLVIAMSPKTLNGQLVGGAIGFSFGTSMFVRGIGKLFNSLRLKRSVPTDTDPDGEGEL